MGVSYSAMHGETIETLKIVCYIIGVHCLGVTLSGLSLYVVHVDVQLSCLFVCLD